MDQQLNKESNKDVDLDLSGGSKCYGAQLLL